MKIDPEELYHRIARRWYEWAEEHGQVPHWPPRHGSQTHHMAVQATNEAVKLAQRTEAEALEDVADFVRAQARAAPHKQTSDLLHALASALEDGSWEEM